MQMRLFIFIVHIFWITCIILSLKKRHIRDVNIFYFEKLSRDRFITTILLWKLYIITPIFQWFCSNVCKSLFEVKQKSVENEKQTCSDSSLLSYTSWWIFFEVHHVKTNTITSIQTNSLSTWLLFFNCFSKLKVVYALQ